MKVGKRSLEDASPYNMQLAPANLIVNANPDRKKKP